METIRMQLSDSEKARFRQFWQMMYPQEYVDTLFDKDTGVPIPAVPEKKEKPPIPVYSRFEILDL